MEAELYSSSSVQTIIPTLNAIHDRFVRMFRITLSGALRRPIDVKVRSTELVKFGEYLKSVPVPSSLNLFWMRPLKGVSILMLEPQLVYNLVDIFYGGKGEFEVNAEGRDFTVIEQRLIKRVVISALEDLQTAWKPYYKIAITYARTEINPQFVAIVPQNSSVFVTNFDVEMGLKPMTISLCLPSEMVNPLKLIFNIKGVISSPFVKNLTDLLDLGYRSTPLPSVVQNLKIKIKQSLNNPEFPHVVASSCANDPENYRELSKPISGDESPPLAGLQHLDPKLIARHISNEHPQTIALILAHLINPKKTAGAIESLPQNLRADVTYRMAILESIPPGVITEIEAVLKQELEKIEANPSKDVGGIKPTAEILDAMDKKSGDHIIKTIKASNPGLAESLEKSMGKKVKKSVNKTTAKKTTRKTKS